MNLKIRGEIERDDPVELFLKKDKDGNVHLMAQREGEIRGRLLEITTEGHLRLWNNVPTGLGFPRIVGPGSLILDFEQAEDADYA